MIAVLAIETGIAPNDLLGSPPEILDSMLSYLQEKAQEDKNEQLRRELRERIG